MAADLVDKSDTLAKRAYRRIRKLILSGELRPGQRLSLRPMAKSLGTSLAPVVDAFRELNRDGLIETEAGWGARVRRLDRDSLWNQHVLRAALECEAIRHCTQRASDRQMDELMALAEQLDHCSDGPSDPERVQELDSEFHLRIARLSGSASLVEALKANQLVRLLARGSILAHDMELPKRVHVEIVQSIRTRDPEQAQRAMRSHCVRSMELQLAHLDVGEVGMN